MTRVAVDTVRAGAPAPEVVRGALVAVASDPGLELALVGPAAGVEAALARAGDAAPERVAVVDAPDTVGADDDPLVAVRGRRGASVRVAVGRVADGTADAVVSAGPVAATAVAARFTLPRLPGLRHPALAVDVVLDGGTITVVDAGAEPEATAGALVRYGELGAALARRRGRAAPRVAALAPFGASTRAVQELVALFDAADLGDGRFVGARDATAVLAGDADVVVTAGAAGRLLVETVRALRPGSPAAGVLLGVGGTVAVLAPAPAPAVAAALLDVASLARAAAPAGDGA